MKTEIVEVTNIDGSITKHIIIDQGNNEYISMPKSVYDEQQAQQVEHLTEIIPADEA